MKGKNVLNWIKKWAKFKIDYIVLLVKFGLEGFELVEFLK